MTVPGLGSSSITKAELFEFCFKTHPSYSFSLCKAYLFYVVPHGSLAGISRSFPAQNHICPISFWCIDSCRSSWGLSFSCTKTHRLLSVHTLCPHQNVLIFRKEKKIKKSNPPSKSSSKDTTSNFPPSFLATEGKECKNKEKASNIVKNTYYSYTSLLKIHFLICNKQGVYL